MWLRAVKVMAELDCLFSLAQSSMALGEPTCRPEFVESSSAYIDFENLRHPALCLNVNSFIPNDVKLGGSVGRIALLTGGQSILYSNRSGFTIRFVRSKYGVMICQRLHAFLSTDRLRSSCSGKSTASVVFLFRLTAFDCLN